MDIHGWLTGVVPPCNGGRIRGHDMVDRVPVRLTEVEMYSVLHSSFCNRRREEMFSLKSGRRVVGLMVWIADTRTGSNTGSASRAVAKTGSGTRARAISVFMHVVLGLWWRALIANFLFALVFFRAEEALDSSTHRAPRVPAKLRLHRRRCRRGHVGAERRGLDHSSRLALLVLRNELHGDARASDQRQCAHDSHGDTQRMRATRTNCVVAQAVRLWLVIQQRSHFFVGHFFQACLGRH